MTCWAVILRSDTTQVHITCVMNLMEIVKGWRALELRMRFNPEMRLITIRLPIGTKREQIYAAFELLTPDEMVRLYNLPQRPLARDRGTD